MNALKNRRDHCHMGGIGASAPSLTYIVMPGHSRSKNGVASLAYVPGIHVFNARGCQKRGWPGQARP
jgi:hypothetical protein